LASLLVPANKSREENTSRNKNKQVMEAKLPRIETLSGKRN